MSDETPKLRLKPRLISDSPAPAAAASPAAAVEAPAPAAPAAAVAVPPPPAPPPAAPEAAQGNPLGAPMPPIGAPAPAAPPPATPPPAAPTFKLKAKPSAPTAPPPDAVAPPPPFPLTTAAPPPLPKPTAAAVATPPAGDVLIGAPPEIAVSPEAAAEKTAATAQANKRMQRLAVVVGCAGLAIFSAVGYLAFGKFKRDQEALDKLERLADAAEKEAEERPAAKSKSPRNETPSPAADAVPVATAPSAPAETPPQTAPANPATATPVATAPATPAPDAGPPAPSDNFVKWVNNLKIAGVRSGETPRVLIERATFRPGDVVNPQLGIVFDGYDDVRRMLRFKDKTGAIVERRDR